MAEAAIDQLAACYGRSERGRGEVERLIDQSINWLA